MPTGVASTKNGVSATVGDCRGDSAGMSSKRVFTSIGGNSGVVANRSRSTSSTSISSAFAFALAISIFGEVMRSSRRSRLLSAVRGGNLSTRSWP